MYTIRLDVKDSIFDKVIFFLNNLPKSEVHLKIEKNENRRENRETLVEFFQNSPLTETVELQRDKEQYKGRVEF